MNEALDGALDSEAVEEETDAEVEKVPLGLVCQRQAWLDVGRGRCNPDMPAPPGHTVAQLALLLHAPTTQVLLEVAGDIAAQLPAAKARPVRADDRLPGWAAGATPICACRSDPFACVCVCVQVPAAAAAAPAEVAAEDDELQERLNAMRTT